MKEMERSLGIVSVVAIALSAMLGNGIFVLPGLAAQVSGPSVWLAYLAAGLLSLPAAASKAEMATAMPTSGGAFIYMDRGFGPWVGTIAGVAAWLASLLKAAFALIGVGVYLVVLADLPIVPTALGLLTVIVLLNWVGVKAVSRAQTFIMAGVFVFLVFLTFMTAVAGDFLPTAERGEPKGLVGIAAGAALVSVAFDGVTKIAAIAEEVKNPDQTLPWGIFLSLAISIFIYASVAAVLCAAVPPEQLHGDPRPIFTWAEMVAGTVWGKVAAGFGVLSLAALANTGLLAASRFLFAMSRDELLPKALQTLNQRFQTPGVSIAITGLGMALSVVLLDVTKLAKLASFIVVALYVANCLAAIVYRESGVGWYRPKFKQPLYPWLPAAGVLSGGLILTQFGWLAILGTVLAVAPGTALYLLYGRRRVTRRGIVLQRGRRRDLLSGARPSQLPAQPRTVRPSMADTLRGELQGEAHGEADELTPPPQSVSSLTAVDVEDAITGRARAIVAMIGDERGPETLAEIGTALSGWGRLPVVHLTEVPEQTILGAMGDAPALLSLRRRLRVMAEEEGARLEFHSVHSRDIVRTVHAITSRMECDFLVMGWRGRSRWALMPYNPLGWLVDHLVCNLALFRDAGVRYIREILVFAEPGPHDALAVGTADDLARRWGARLTLVRPVKKTDSKEKHEAELSYLKELSELCEAPTRTALAIGVDVVSAITRESTAYDLLVMGSPQASLLARFLGTIPERITRKAACSVLMLKTPRLRTHEAYAKKREAQPTELVHFVNEEAARPRIGVTRKEALFDHIASVFGAMLKVEARLILEALWERERTQNTSVGHGVALPHATLDAVKSTVVGVFTVAQPLNYHGPDGEKVDVVFVIVSPPKERQRHLELLSTIARLSLSTPLLKDLREAKTKVEMMMAVRRSEQSQSTIASLASPDPSASDAATSD